MSEANADAGVKKQHPKGLYLLFVTEMAERFSYYGMRALFTLYLLAAFFSQEMTSQIYGSYTGLVYLTPLLGGYIADRYWGNRRSIIVGGLVMALGQFLMFLSACFVQQSIFVKNGAIDPNIDNSFSLFLMFSGLVALILGNGFFKPNISTMVGDLYEPTDSRKDSAFTIFYMGINVGAFIAPLICSTIGEGSWNNLAPFKWGFLCACIAMVLSVVVFTALKDKYLVTPEGLGIGLPPKHSELRKLKDAAEKSDTETEKNEASDAETAQTALENKDEAKTQVKNSPIRLWGCILGALSLFIFFSPLFNMITGSAAETSFNDYISAAIYSLAIALPVFIITDKTLTRTEKSRIGVIYVIAVFVIFFWSAFEQAGSSLTIFADKQVDRAITDDFEFKTGWFQSVNPIVVVTFAPIMAMLWEKLSKKNKEPHSIVKQAMGLALLSIGYFVIAFATHGVEPGVKITMFWLIALYFIHTIGELCLSPIGLSMVNKLAPAHLASLLMGVWFMSNAASNILAGKLAALLPTPPSAPVYDTVTLYLSQALPQIDVPSLPPIPKHFLGFEIASLDAFFLVFAFMAGAAAIVLFALSPLLKKMMKGIN